MVILVWTTLKCSHQAGNGRRQGETSLSRVQKDGSENSQEILSIFDGYQQSQKHRNRKKNPLCRLTVGKVLPIRGNLSWPPPETLQVRGQGSCRKDTPLQTVEDLVTRLAQPPWASFLSHQGRRGSASQPTHFTEESREFKHNSFPECS